MMSREGQGPDWFGRSVGLIGFFVGIGLLVVVFVLTILWLAAPNPPAGVKVDYWAQHGATMLIRMAQLFIMGFVASWIAGRGAQMYAAANRWASGEA
jgi:hypothetical protein